MAEVLTHEGCGTMSIEAIYSNSICAFFKKKLHEVGKVQPCGHAQGDNAIGSSMGRIQAVEGYLGLAEHDANGIQTFGCHERRVRRVDVLPPERHDWARIMKGKNIYGVPVASDGTHDWGTSLVVESVDVGAGFEGMRDSVVVAVQSGAVEIIEAWGHVVEGEKERRENGGRGSVLAL
jgi:hypothetical protein